MLPLHYHAISKRFEALVIASCCYKLWRLTKIAVTAFLFSRQNNISPFESNLFNFAVSVLTGLEGFEPSKYRDQNPAPYRLAIALH